MKIRLHPLELGSYAVRFKPFVIDTDQTPELELEVQAIAKAAEDGNSMKMSQLMMKLEQKMWEVDFSIPYEEPVEEPRNLLMRSFRLQPEKEDT